MFICVSLWSRRRRRIPLTCSAVALLLLMLGSAWPLSAKEGLARKTISLPIHFEQDRDGSFSTHAGRVGLHIERGGRVRFSGAARDPLTITLAGASAALPSGQQLLPGKSNYFVGSDATQWRRGVEQFAQARVDGVYPGIDLLYYGNGQQLEHDYLVAAGADPGHIRMKFGGAHLSLDSASGDLLLSGSGAVEEMRLKRPAAYQLASDGSHTPVEARYASQSDGTIGFTLGEYDHAKQLVIDPVILYASYLGGNQTDSIVDMKLGSDNSLYLLMTTASTDLKTVAPPSGACGGTCGPTNSSIYDQDMYVAKLDPTGQTLLFATYLGGSNNDVAVSLALDSDGSVYIAGDTLSSDFPQLNAYPGGSPTKYGEAIQVGTLSKLSADGSKILYSTFIGFGALSEEYLSGGSSILVSANHGIVYLLGLSNLGDPSYFIWKKNALFSIGKDFVAEIDTTKTGTDSVVWATQVGDSNSYTSSTSAYLTSLALDSKGDVWLYGGTFNSAFPVASSDAVQPKCNTKGTACSSSFLMELNSAGSSEIYSTFLGGANQGNGEPGNFYSYASQIDGSDNIYVSGNTNQADLPIKNGVYTAPPGAGYNGFFGYAGKLSPDGKMLLYSSYLYSQGQAGLIGVSSDGKLAFADSAGSGFPLKNNLQTTAPAGQSQDAYFGLIDPTKSGDDSLLLSSYLGAVPGVTIPLRILTDASSQILIVGQTGSSNLPVTNAFQASCNSCATTQADGFVALIQASGALTVKPTALNFPATAVGASSATMTAEFVNQTANTIQTSTPVLSDSKDFTATGDCSTIDSGASCTVTFTFNPKSSGTSNATYTLVDEANSSNSATLTLSGSASGGAAKGSLSPTSVNFGTEYVNHGTPKEVTYTNTTSSTVTISGKTITPSVFTVATDNCGTTVAPGSSCTYVLFFEPTAVQTYNGSFTVADGGSNPSISLTGIGTSAGATTLTPSPLDFGAVYENQTVTKTVTYTNTGVVTATITAAATSLTIFKLTGTTCGQTVAAGASCTYTISYTPFGVGDIQGTFSVTDGASNPSIVVKGTGIQAPYGQVYLIPGAVNFGTVTTTDPSLPSSKLVLSNQSSSMVVIDAADLTIGGADPTYFSYELNFPGLCSYNPNYSLHIEVPPMSTCILPVDFQNHMAPPDRTFNANLNILYYFLNTTTKYPLTVALTASTISAAQPVITPTNIQFPATANGQKSQAAIVNISNTGDQAFNFITPTLVGANPSAFTFTTNCPASITKATPCQIGIYFTPPATGNEFTATLQVIPNDNVVLETDITLAGGTSASDFIFTTQNKLQFTPNPKWTFNIAPLTPSIGFPDPITFTVSGLDASFGTAVFNPATVTPGKSSVSTTLTLTAPPSSSLKRQASGATAWITGTISCLIFLISFRRRSRSYRQRITLLLLILACMALTATGCNPIQPPDNFTVTATSGKISHTINLTLQPD